MNIRVRNPVVGLAAVLIALLALILWWLAGGDSTDPAVDPVVTAPRPVGRPIAPGGVVGEEPEAAPADEPALDAMAALAAVDGRGYVRCVVGEVVSGPVRAAGLVRPRVSGGVLVAEVEEAAGSSVLYADLGSGVLEVREATLGEDGQLVIAPLGEAAAAREDDATAPRARLTWSGAAPGHQGTCRVEPAKPVELTVRSADGRPTGGVSTVGCAVLQSRSADGDGRYLVRATAGMPCEVSLTRVKRDEEGEIVVLEAAGRIDDPRDGETVTLGEWARLVVEGEGDKGAEDEPTDEEAWERALASDGLAPAAREVLERWQEEEFQAEDDLGRQWMQLGELMEGGEKP